MLKRVELNEEAVMALLEAHAAERGGRLAVERVDGRWRAGFVLPIIAAARSPTVPHRPWLAAVLEQLVAMQFRPCEHKPKLPDLEIALDHLDLVNAHLRARARVPRVEVRKAVVIEIHRDHDPVEAADRRHSADAAASSGRKPRMLPPSASALPPTRAAVPTRLVCAPRAVVCAASNVPARDAWIAAVAVT